MRKVLYDMQMAEAIVSVEYEKYGTPEKKQKVYDAVFHKYGITQAEYDSSLIWYGKNMDLYMDVYKLVLKDIEKNIDLLGGETRPSFRRNVRKRYIEYLDSKQPFRLCAPNFIRSTHLRHKTATSLFTGEFLQIKLRYLGHNACDAR
jgi:hypothetical protein